MLIHHLSGRASEWCLASHHYPECYTKRVQIRADVHPDSTKLFRAGEFWCPGKASRCRNSRLRSSFGHPLGQPKVDYLRRYAASFLQANHDVAWLDVSMNQLCLVYRSQTGDYFRHNFQRQLHFDSPRASDEVFKGLSLHELHRIKVILA